MGEIPGAGPRPGAQASWPGWVLFGPLVAWTLIIQPRAAPPASADLGIWNRPGIRGRLHGAAARAAITSTCSLDRIVEQELALLEDLCLSQ